MANSVYPDQLASEANSDPDLHCLQRQGISGFSRTRVNCLTELLWCFFFFRCIIEFVIIHTQYNTCTLYVLFYVQLPVVQKSWKKKKKKKSFEAFVIRVCCSNTFWSWTFKSGMDTLSRMIILSDLFFASFWKSGQHWKERFCVLLEPAQSTYSLLVQICRV